MLKIIKPKDHAEWLAHRQAGIGSSEVATIVGLNPYETNWQYWMRKTGRAAPIEENEAMQSGHDLEPIVAKRFAQATGNHVIKSSEGDWIIYDDDAPHRRVSPDRLFWRKGDKHNQHNRRILECKTLESNFRGNAIDPDDIPKHWFTQLQYQMGVAGVNYGALAWLVNGRHFGYVYQAFIPAYFEWICSEVDKFWKENIIEDKEPELIVPDDAIKKYVQHTEGKIIEATPELTEEIIKIKMLKEQKKTIEAALNESEGKVKMAMLDAEALTFNGETLATWKASKPSRKLDTKSIPDAIAAQYMIEVPGTRRFNIK